MLVKCCWAILALIHALPAIAFFWPSLLTKLYNAQPDSAAYLLLHHRAALFVGVFVACIWAMLEPKSRPLAAAIVSISLISFLGLYTYGGMPNNLRLIAIADLVALPFFATIAWHAFKES